MRQKTQRLASRCVIACVIGLWTAGGRDLVAEQGGPSAQGTAPSAPAPPYVITHLYSDAQSLTHFKDMDIKDGELIKAVGVQLARRAAANSTWDDRRPAPVRRFIVVLSGQVELMVDGDIVKSFGPGDIVFLDEKPGSGHRARTVGGVDVSWVFIDLDHYQPAAPRPASAAARPAPQPPRPTVVTSVYTGPDGKAHFREKELTSNSERPAISVAFSRRPAADATWEEWRLTPSQRYIIPLGSSRVEIMVGDDPKNETKTFGRGDIVLMETTGEKASYRTRPVVTPDGHDVRWMFIELGDPRKK